MWKIKGADECGEFTIFTRHPVDKGDNTGGAS